ncbi:MAG: class I SAM-dependent methyltransferase [Bacteroidetes bacterium]|nr:MAG: class I SAM-dependent methyltransferase [Bacteroidota bacterium]
MSSYDYKDIASEYDDLCRQYQWKAPDLLFNYLSKYIRKDTKLLDIGVGTGISSQQFHDMQVELYGLDNSSEMLAICEAKKVFKEVLLFDILEDEIPYPEAHFEYLICLGVFHFFSSLDEIFAEIGRAVKSNGFFAFTIIENSRDDKSFVIETSDEVNVYHHSKDYIKSLIKQNNFNPLYEKTFTTLKDLEKRETMDHKLIIVQKE